MDWATSEFKKVVAISKEDYDFINEIRKKKSKAGMLKEIIMFYKKNGLHKI